MTWSISAVPAEGVRHFWSTVAPLLAPAIALTGGRYDLRSVFDDLSSSRKLLWVVYEEALVVAALTTRLATYPRKTMLSIDFVGGSRMQDWFSLASETLSRYAADAGASGLEHRGRVGWDRWLRNDGWHRVGMAHEKGLGS